MPVVVDTSIWIDHLRAKDNLLTGLLREKQVVTTETVLGEISAGAISNRRITLGALLDLPRLADADFRLALLLLEDHSLHGIGLNWPDIVILATCFEHNIKLYSRDARLRKAAAKLNLSL